MSRYIDPALREGISAMINGQSDMCMVDHAATGRRYSKIREHLPDVTLMHVRLPDQPAFMKAPTIDDRIAKYPNKASTLFFAPSATLA